jgi:predicted aconitase with swiveling domain
LALLNEPLTTLTVAHATGSVVDGEALVSAHGFSPRYDLDRWSGVVTRAGHDLEGVSLVNKVCFFVSAKGGIAAGWAFHDLKTKGIAPRALVFGEVNPVMVQGAIFAGLTLADGLSPSDADALATGMWVRVDPGRCVIEILRKRRSSRRVQRG